MTDRKREKLARRSLLGLSVGDAFGETFFGELNTVKERIERHQLSSGIWHYTDDTAMAISIVQNLLLYGEIRQEKLAQAFAKSYVKNPQRGYGRGAAEILQDIYYGSPWKKTSASVFEGQGSKGNGAAMRSAPIGAYFFDNPEKAAEQARRSAQVTHYHPAGQEGAAAIALAASWVINANKQQRQEMNIFEYILSFLKEGAVKEAVKKAALFPKWHSASDAAGELGSGQKALAEDTVPYVIWCVNHHWNDYEKALWLTVSGLGDRDTTCAMSGGIVALSGSEENIPQKWRECTEQIENL